MFGIRYNNFSITFENHWRVSVAFPDVVKLRADDYVSTERSDTVEVALVREGDHVRDDFIAYGVTEKQLLRFMAIAQSLPNRDFEECPITPEMLDAQYVLKRVRGSLV